MTNKPEQDRRFSAAYALHRLNNTAADKPAMVSGIAIRAALATVLMYLLFISFHLMGTAGVVVISLFFLVSLLAPALIKIQRLRKQRLARRAEALEPVAQTED